MYARTYFYILLTKEYFLRHRSVVMQYNDMFVHYNRAVIVYQWIIFFP